MENENKKYRGKLVLLLLGIGTILMALIGATFAYFSTVINETNGKQSVMLTTATVKGLVYEATKPLVLTDARPNAHADSVITVNNPNASVVATYTMELVTDINRFENTDGDNQLVLSISGGQLNGTKEIDLTDGNDTSNRVIVASADIRPGVTDTYQVSIDFRDLGKPQDTNQGKTYVGHIVVTQSIITQRAE